MLCNLFRYRDLKEQEQKTKELRQLQELNKSTKEHTKPATIEVDSKLKFKVRNDSENKLQLEEQDQPTKNGTPQKKIKAVSKLNPKARYDCMVKKYKYSNFKCLKNSFNI